MFFLDTPRNQTFLSVLPNRGVSANDFLQQIDAWSHVQAEVRPLLEENIEIIKNPDVGKQLTYKLIRYLVWNQVFENHRFPSVFFLILTFQATSPIQNPLKNRRFASKAPRAMTIDLERFQAFAWDGFRIDGRLMVFMVW